MKRIKISRDFQKLVDKSHYDVTMSSDFSKDTLYLVNKVLKVGCYRASVHRIDILNELFELMCYDGENNENQF